jgi:hypothetical protein
MIEEEREAWLAAEEVEPLDPEEWWDPDGPPPPGEDELTPEELAGIRQAAADEVLALKAASTGRRGPSQPGSARVFPGESSSAAAAFGPGLVLDVTPGCPGLALAADAASGDSDRFGGASDAELVGVLCAWDRIEAHAAGRKLAAVAELIRRRPETGCEPGDPARMPTSWDEFIADELTPGGLRAAIVRAVMEVAPDKARKRREAAARDARVQRWIEEQQNPGARDGPGFAFTATDDRGPPGGYGTWRLRTPGAGPDLIVMLDPITTQDCDHRFEARGHDPGARLRHLSQVRHATCTSPVCRRPAATSDFEHNVPFEAGGRTCLCNGGPKCRRDHRLKQHPRWHVDQLPDGTFTWTAPSGRQYTSAPDRYPI